MLLSRRDSRQLLLLFRQSCIITVTMAAPTRRAATFTLIASAASAATYNLPPMGWNSWFAYDQWLNETGMRSNADQLANLGLRDMGFKYLNLDGGWQVGDST